MALDPGAFCLIGLSVWKLLSYCRLLRAKLIVVVRSKQTWMIKRTLRQLLVSAALEPRTRWSRIDLRFMFKQILALLNFHFGLPKLAQ